MVILRGFNTVFGFLLNMLGGRVLGVAQKRKQGVLIKVLMKDYELSKTSIYRCYPNSKLRF